jgi:hypothetical protein
MERIRWMWREEEGRSFVAAAAAAVIEEEMPVLCVFCVVYLYV